MILKSIIRIITLLILVNTGTNAQICKCQQDQFTGQFIVQSGLKPLYANPIAGERINIAFQALDSLFFAKVRFQSKQLIYQDFIFSPSHCGSIFKV